MSYSGRSMCLHILHHNISPTGSPIFLLLLCLPMCAKSLELCLILCDSMGSSPPGSSVHGILQARILEWAAISYASHLPDPGIEPVSPALADGHH